MFVIQLPLQPLQQTPFLLLTPPIILDLIGGAAV